MISISLPLPWTFESAWTLLQLGVQLAFVVAVIIVLLGFIALTINEICKDF